MASFRRLQILQSPNSPIKLTALFLCPSKISGGCPLIDPLEYGTGPACPPLPGLQVADKVHWSDPSWRTSRCASSWRASHNCASARESWSVRATSPPPPAPPPLMPRLLAMPLAVGVVTPAPTDVALPNIAVLPAAALAGVPRPAYSPSTRGLVGLSGDLGSKSGSCCVHEFLFSVLATNLSISSSYSAMCSSSSAAARSVVGSSPSDASSEGPSVGPVSEDSLASSGRLWSDECFCP